MSVHPTKICARVINGVYLLHNTTVTCLVIVAWLASEFAAASITTNKHIVGTFLDVKHVTVNGGTFVTNLTDVPAQVQSSRPPAQRDPYSGEQEVGSF